MPADLGRRHAPALAVAGLEAGVGEHDADRALEARVLLDVGQALDAVALHEAHGAGVPVGPDRLGAVALLDAQQVRGDLVQRIVPADPPELARALLAGALQREAQPVGMMVALVVAGDLGADHAGGERVALRARAPCRAGRRAAARPRARRPRGSRAGRRRGGRSSARSGCGARPGQVSARRRRRPAARNRPIARPFCTATHSARSVLTSRATRSWRRALRRRSRAVAAGPGRCSRPARRSSTRRSRASQQDQARDAERMRRMVDEAVTGAEQAPSGPRRPSTRGPRPACGAADRRLRRVVLPAAQSPSMDLIGAPVRDGAGGATIGRGDRDGPIGSPTPSAVMRVHRRRSSSCVRPRRRGPAAVSRSRRAAHRRSAGLRRLRHGSTRPSRIGELPA